MNDRIQIDGIWYVKESKQEPLDIIFYDGAVYEDEYCCIEASRGIEYNSISIKVTDKNTNTKEYIDNQEYLKDVINGEIVDFMNEELFRNFLITLNWIK